MPAGARTGVDPMGRGRMGRRRPQGGFRRGRLGLLGVGVGVVLLTLAVNLPLNVVSGDDKDPWPGGLDLLRRYAWQSIVVIVLLIILLVIWSQRSSWRAEDDRDSEMSASPEALEAAAEALAVTTRHDLDVELSSRRLGGVIDLALTRHPRDRSSDPLAVSRLSGVASAWRDRTRRLIVVGAAGSGKSTALSLLTRQLLPGHPLHGPVPVMVNLSTWDPRSEHLDDAIRHRLAALPGSTITRRRAVRRRRGVPIDLVSTRRVLPVLDGLDELPKDMWPDAQLGLAAALEAPDREFILACSADAFDDLVPSECIHVGGTRVVSIEPVDLDSVIDHLWASPLGGGERWEPVFDYLRSHPHSPLAVALSSPLMVHLALICLPRRRRGPRTPR